MGPIILYLAADDPTHGPEYGKASPIGLLVILILLVATILLIRSMNGRIKRLPETFDRDRPEADQQADDGTDITTDK